MIRILPREAAERPLPHTVLAHGERTGHSRSVPASLFAGNGCFSLDVRGDRAQVVRDEHGAIPLAQSVYGVGRQREYTPRRIVAVQD